MVELRLIHDGKCWVAENESVTAKGATLKELDREVARALAAAERLEVSRELSVRMTFDNSLIPQWMRQYAAHYFNRVVTIRLPGP